MKTISLAIPAAYLRKNVFELQLLLLTMLVLLVALWIVAKASGHKTALHAEELRASRAASTLGTWTATFQPAASDESAAWRQTSIEARQLGVRHDERLAITAEIAGQAERPGFTDVRVAFAPPDSAPAAPIPRTAGPYVFVPAPYRILINFRGDLASTRDLLGNLPAAALVTGMKFKRDGSALRGSITLNVYELAGGQ